MMPGSLRPEEETPRPVEDGVNAFFSRSIVGGPMSIHLGTPATRRGLAKIGVEHAPESFITHMLSSGHMPPNTASLSHLPGVTAHRSGRGFWVSRATLIFATCTTVAALAVAAYALWIK